MARGDTDTSFSVAEDRKSFFIIPGLRGCFSKIALCTMGSAAEDNLWQLKEVVHITNHIKNKQERS
ncbi:MAG: hypothetical protein EBR93_01595 [Bacteroidetes bacterium]|nr:hypothetical protein [Bacteroidota bacterium]